MLLSSANLAFWGPSFQASWPVTHRVREHRQPRISSENRAVLVGVPWVFAVSGIWGPNLELSMPVSSVHLAFGGPNLETSWSVPYRVREHRQSRIPSENRTVLVGVPWFFAVLGICGPNSNLRCLYLRQTWHSGAPTFRQVGPYHIESENIASLGYQMKTVQF